MNQEEYINYLAIIDSNKKKENLIKQFWGKNYWTY